MKQFRGPLAFLSNMDVEPEHPIVIDFGDGIVLAFPSMENAFQAMKCARPEDREPFITLTPAQARQHGQRVQMHADWDAGRKLHAMQYGLAQKFKHPALAQRLVDTREDLITEINDWGDTYWGICNGVGEDHLGRLLRKIRQDLLSMGYQPSQEQPTVVPAPRADPLYPWVDRVIREEELPDVLAECGPVYAVTGHRPKDIKAYKAERVQAFLADQLRARLPKGRKAALILGGAAGVDQDMHHAANRLKKEGWPIVVITAMPFDGQWQKWPKWAQDKFHTLVATSDHVVVLADNPGDDRDLAVQLLMERNAFMCDHACSLLAFWSGKFQGGTFQCRKYAKELALPVVELYPGWEQFAAPVLATPISTCTYPVKIGERVVPHKVAVRSRSVTLSLALRGDQVQVRLESEDVSRSLFVATEPGPDLVTHFRAITAGLTSLKAGTPVTIATPAVRDLVCSASSKAAQGFLDRHGKDIPFRKDWEELWTSLKDREVYLA